VLSSAQVEQTEECVTTGSPNNESISATGDADADPDYSLSDDSYSDNSDNQSSSFDEVKTTLSFALLSVLLYFLLCSSLLVLELEEMSKGENIIK